MTTSYKDGAIQVIAKFFEKTQYDAGNLLLNARFDGYGGISRYAVINKFEAIDALRLMMSVDGRPLDFSEQKTLEIIGRRMTISVDLPKISIRLTQFLPEKENTVITRIGLTAKEDCKFEAAANWFVNITSYIERFFMSRFGLKTALKAAMGFLNKHIRTEGNVIRNDILGDFYVDFASNHALIPMERNGFFVNQFKVGTELKKGQKTSVDMVMSSGTRRDFSDFDATAILGRIDLLEKEAEEYTNSLKRFSPDFSELEKALYVSCLNCVLSNYKERGKFKAFLAGLVYQFPARTYFRDGYWTALTALGPRPELVRNQIRTLARGISKNGKCPSAVKWNFKNFWGDHCDSPSFFVMLIYDYVMHTKDVSVLQEKSKNGTILSLAKIVMERLKKQTDETGLLLKSGEYNRRDWCDNVFRTGYVTYDEALYARALFCLSGLLSMSGDKAGAAQYGREFERVKQAINAALWDEEKGYFVNYKDGDKIENNLSIDTVVMAIFDLASEDRIIRMLKNMENILESKNNGEQCAGDFGTLSVYPFYRNTDVVQKSSFPYYYHNGGDWPYLSAAYAYAKLKAGLDYKYPLTRWFTYNLEKGNFTPVEFFSPLHPDGSLMQGWSGFAAYVLEKAHL